MADIVYRFHVFGPYMSGRAVKFRLLGDSEIREGQSSVIKAMKKGDTVFDVRAAERHEGILRMLTHVSPEDTQPADFDADTVAWTPVSLMTLMAGDCSLEKLFPFPRDMQTLEKLYTATHELDLVEADVAGKLVPVSLG